MEGQMEPAPPGETTEEWWRDSKTTIDYIPGESVRTLHGRQLEDGSWEYAIVQWWYGNPTLLMVFKDGEITFEV